MVRPFHVQGLPASTGLTMETLWIRQIHVVLERPPSGNDALLCSFQNMKRKDGSNRHLSLDAHHAATVWPVTADALGRVLEIRKK